MPATTPLWRRSVAWLKSAYAVCVLCAGRLGACRGRQGLKVCVGGDKHDELARALVGVRRRGDVVALRAKVVDRAQIVDGHRAVDARVIEVERADDGRDALG